MQIISKIGPKCQYCDCHDFSLCNGRPSVCLIVDWTAVLHSNRNSSTQYAYYKLEREVHFFFSKDNFQKCRASTCCCTLSHRYTHTHARTRTHADAHRLTSAGCLAAGLQLSQRPVPGEITAAITKHDCCVIDHLTNLSTSACQIDPLLSSTSALSE